MTELERRLPGVAIRTIDAYGVPAAAKEGLVFALIGFLTVHGLPAIVPSCTGARHASVLGAVVPGRTSLAVAGGATPPDALLVRTPLAAGAPA
jgi:anhydro-N-acetylmuramic acid kinase